MTGVCTATYSYDDIPLFYVVAEAERTDAVNSLYGHTVSGVTLNNATLHGVNFYDDYAFIGKNGVPTSLNYATPPSGYGTRYTGGYKGLLTGTVTARLDASGVAGYDYTAYYYDDRGRVIQTRSTNHLGGTDVEYVTYNFVGDPVKRQHVHTASGKATQTETYTYTYDHAGRLTVTKYKLNSNAEITLSSNTYDELGRLKTKSLHGSATNKQTYSYNIRDWLTGISGSKLTQNLYYNTGNGTPQYGGNISSMTWKVGNESTTRGYKFAYDGLNRLTSATYGEGISISSNANRFTEKVTGYDLNGNIKGLQRYGQTGASTYGLIDNLTYTLSGNQVTRVDDATTAAAYNNGSEFKDAVKQASEYAYDKNGNLTKDLNKNITGIQYNCLNLPSKVTFGNGNTITYTYAADGTKLRTVHKAGSTTTTTDYCGNVVYENGTQKLLLTEEGYVTLADSKYHYYLKDHQGNNRVVISQSGTVEETNHYYPFGGVFAATNNVQPYKYNGKEFDNKNGLNWYDYGARHYDAALGRFVSVDPLAEKYLSTSPYGYCLNNPIMYIDPEGGYVVAASGAEQKMILNTLPKDLQRYVVFDRRGYINQEIIKDVRTSSLNFNSLKAMVLSETTVEVKLDNKFTYSDEFGNIKESEMPYFGVDEEFVGNNSGKGVGTSTGETGFLGKTLFPDKAGLQNSPNSNIKIIVNSELSEEGQAQTYSHEANGHAYTYIKTQGDRKQASHQYGNGGVDLNRELFKRINESINETIRNMR